MTDLYKSRQKCFEIRQVASAVAISMAILVAGCGHKSDAELLAEAQAAHLKGDDAAAQVLLKTYLANNPKQLEARFIFAQVLNGLEDGVGAERELKKLEQMGREAGALRVELARALYLQGNYVRIVNDIKPDGLPVKDAATVLAIRGNAYLAMRRINEGRAQLEAALSQVPDLAAAKIGLARYWVMTRRFDQAINELDMVLKSSPQHKEALLLKAEVLRGKNDLSSALLAYQNILKLYPRSAAASLGKTMVLMQQGKIKEAQTELNAARKMTPPNASVFYTQALIDYHNTKWNEANSNVLNALKLSPNDGPTQLLAGTIAYARQAYNEATNYLNQYLSEYPGDVKARKVLSYVYLALHQPKQVQDLLAPVVRELPDDVESLALLSSAASQLGSYAQAIELLQHATQLDPKNSALLTDLGANKLANGQINSGLDDLWRASRLSPKQSRSDVIIVVSLAKQKEFDKALSALAELEKKEPQNPVYADLRGGVYFAQGDNINARKAYELAFAKSPTNTLIAGNLAKIDLVEKKPADAIKRYLGIIEKDKKNVPAMLAVAHLYSGQGQVAASIQWLEKVVAVDANNIEASILLGNHLIQSGESQKALAIADRMRSHYPEKPDVWRFLARCQLALGDKVNALASAKRAVSISPDYALAWYEVGGLAARMGHVDEAKAAFEKAVELAPSNLENKIALMQLLAANGQFAEAKKIAMQIQTIAPKGGLGYELEGDLNMRQKRYSDALTAYNKAMQLQRTSELAVRIYQAQLGLGRVDAEEGILNWLKQNPDDMYVREAYAKSLLARAHAADAIAQYQAILAKKPDHVAALNNLALALFDTDRSKAISYAEQAIKLAPKQPAVLDTLGWLLLRDDQLKRALPLLEEAQALAGDSYPEIQYHYAAALAKSGEKFRAKTILQNLVNSKKSFAEAASAQKLLGSL